MNFFSFTSLISIGLFAASGIFSCEDFFTRNVRLGGENVVASKNSTSSSSSSSSSGGSSTTSPEDDDGDGLSNETEEAFSLDPQTADSDADGFADGIEFVGRLSDPLNPNQTPTSKGQFKSLSSAVTGFTDSDLDGLANTIESQLGTTSSEYDSDEDGYSDALELIASSDPTSKSSKPTRTTAPIQDPSIIIGTPTVDSDGDGLSDDIERSFSTNLSSKDSDDDGYSDAIEYTMGSDINDAISVPDFN